MLLLKSGVKRRMSASLISSTIPGKVAQTLTAIYFHRLDSVRILKIESGNLIWVGMPSGEGRGL